MDARMTRPGRDLPEGLRWERSAITDPTAAGLVDEVQAEYTVRYGGPDSGGTDPAEFDGDRGAFWVLWSERADGAVEPVGTGAWRWHEPPAGLAGELAAAGVRLPPDVDRCVELKRMFVRAPYRRRGYARIILTALEREVRRAGAQVVVLETGTQQPEAMALYTAHGYVPISVFGPYRGSPLARAYAKVL